jgi:hypothetical protein
MNSLNSLSSTGHSFGRPQLLAADNSIAMHSFTGSQTFQPLPRATGAYPYHLSLADVIGADAEAPTCSTCSTRSGPAPAAPRT